MKIKFREFIAGVVLGAASWAIVPLVSNSFEPYDSGTGLILGQIIMIVGALFFTFSKGIKEVALYIFGIYVGQNAYAYLFGSESTKAWIGLLLIASIVLCVLPLAAVITAKLIKSLGSWIREYNKPIDRDN